MQPSKIIIRLIISLAITSSSVHTFAWTRNLNFDEGSIGTIAQGTSGFDTDAGGSIFDDSISASGSASARLSISEGSTAFGSWGGIINHPEIAYAGDELWFRVVTYMPENFNYDSNGEGSHLKFLRIHTKSDVKSNEGYNDWYINPSWRTDQRPHKFIFEGEQKWSRFGEMTDSPQHAKWETYEMYLKLHPIPLDQGGEAVIRVWKDGRLLDEITHLKTLVSINSYSERTHLFTYWNGGAPATQHMWVDEIVLTNETPANADVHGNPYIGPINTNQQPKPPILHTPTVIKNR